MKASTAERRSEACSAEASFDGRYEEIGHLQNGCDATVARTSSTSVMREKTGKKDHAVIESEKPSLRKLLDLARPEFCALGLALLFMLASEAAGLITPLILAEAYDALVKPGVESSSKLNEVGMAMTKVLSIHVAGIFCGFVRSSIMSVAGERVVARLRNALFSSILRQEIAFFDEHKTGELVSRLGSDTTLVQQASSNALPEVVLGIIKLATCVGLMFWISAELAGVALGLTAVLFLACLPFGRKIGSLAKSYQDALGDAQTCSTEALGAMRTVQSFTAEDRERQRYRGAIGDPDVYGCWFPNSHHGEKRRRTTYSVGFQKSIWTSAFYTFILGSDLVPCMWLCGMDSS